MTGLHKKIGKIGIATKEVLLQVIVQSDIYVPGIHANGITIFA